MNNDQTTKPIVVWSMLILLALIWGSSFILIKKGLLVFSAGEVGAIRLATAGIFLLPLSLPKLNSLTKRQLKWLFISGMLGSFGPAFFFAYAQTRLDSGVTGVLNALTPIFAMLMGVMFFSGKLNRRDIAGIIFGFIGAVLLVTAGSQGDISNLNYFAFFVILATMCYGINLNVLKFKFSKLHPKLITSISLFFIMPFALVYLLGISDFTTKMQQQEGAWLAFTFISILGVVGTALALIIFNKLVQWTSPVFTSFVTYLIPIVAVIWGVIDGEILFFTHYVGIAMIIVGVAFANRPKK